MAGWRAKRTRLAVSAAFLAGLVLVTFTWAVSPAPASAADAPVGVTPKSIKVGIALVDFDCIKNFTDSIREHQDQVYQAFIDGINAKGGVAGRQIKPVYDSYCPVGSAGPLSVCTKLTDDDKVFAVIGTFIDFSGDAQACVAKQHHRVLITFNLTQDIMNKAPGGMMIYPGATNERTAKIVLQLLKSNKTLAHKKVAVLGGTAEASTVKDTIVPGLKKLGLATGSTAVLSVGASTDTTAAQSQLESFIEKWKSQHVTTIFLSGDEVSSKDFVTKIRQAMPKVGLIVDNTDVRSPARDLVQAGVKPNPYEGIISAGGPTPAEYAKSANWKYCSTIYERYTHKKAPGPQQVVKIAGGKTLDTYGAINDACQALTLFHDIGTKVGKNLSNATWIKTVNHLGPVANRGSGPYSSLTKGKYDIEDNFRLEAFDSSLPSGGDWKALTPVENITGQ